MEYNAIRNLLPTCGARSRNSGLPCKRIVPAEGQRCRWHGGKTPRGAECGKVQFPRDPAKLAKKLDVLEHREEKRAARVAAMSPDERKQYERRRRFNKPAPGSTRAADRERRRQAREARRFLEKALGDSEKAAGGDREAAAGIESQIAINPASELLCESLSHMQTNEGGKMADRYEDDEDLEPDFDGDDEGADLRRWIKRKGARIAIKAAVEVCQNAKASPQARASAANTILRAGGYFRDVEQSENKPPHEMTLAEIDARLAQVEREREAAVNAEPAEKAAANENPVGGLFD